MRVFAAVAAVMAGVLLMVIPRFVFPACEYIGRGRMHCTAAAQGELVVGGLLVATGLAMFALKSATGALVASGCAVLLCAAAFLTPAYTRYCANPDMPCHYGMVPSIRFIAVALGLVESAAFIGLARRTLRGSA